MAAQSQPTPSPDATPEAAREERELNEARRSNEKAQAEYYRVQTEKLQQPDPPKTFWRALSDNAAILGALTAALVALFTLVVNQRTALRGRKDTEFYEALKRFGDKDSPTVRASAVAMLAEMSGLSFFAWRWRKKAPWWRPDQNMIRYPYFDTVLDQLVTGLLLEENSVVLHAIVIALKRIFPRNLKRSSDRLREANRKLSVDLLRCMMEFFIAKGTDVDKADALVWNELTSLTACTEQNLRGVFWQFGWPFAKLPVPKETHKLLDENEKRLHIKELQGRLVSIGSRLNRNVSLCELAVRSRPAQASESLNFSFTYLPGVVLMKCNLRNTDFTQALLQGADFGGSNFAGACFQSAMLTETNLRATDLTNAKLNHAIIDSPHVFDESNWWQADFAKEDVDLMRSDLLELGFVDGHLLNQLFSRGGKLSPEQLKEAHPSVKAYVAKRNASREEADSRDLKA